MSVQKFESLKIESLMELMAKTAREVPQDKIDWKPDPKGKSTREILEHLTGANHAFAALIRGESVPASDKQSFSIKPDQMDDAFAALHRSGLHLSEAIAEVTDSQLEEQREMPWGETWKMLRLISSPSSHISYHWGQLAYLQTLWGDQVDHY